MFSLQSDELVFGTPTASKGYEIHEDLKMDHALPETNLINFCTESSNKRVIRTTNSELTHERESNSISRRVLHRNIERNRRKEMSDLHLTLASLLPIEPAVKVIFSCLSLLTLIMWNICGILCNPSSKIRSDSWNPSLVGFWNFNIFYFYFSNPGNLIPKFDLIFLHLNFYETTQT